MDAEEEMKGNFLTSMNGFPYGEPKVGNEIHPSWTTTFILLGRRRSSFLDDDVRDRGTMKGPITTDSIRLIPSSPAGKFRTPLPTFHLSGKPRRSTNLRHPSLSSITQPPVSMAPHGRCYCGAIEWTITGKIDTTGNCHCTDCQRISGSAYGLTSFLVSGAEGVEFKGTPKIIQGKSDAGKSTQRFVLLPSPAPTNESAELR